MRTGFACIFSGPPGTGKTETAYQIARKNTVSYILRGTDPNFSILENLCKEELLDKPVVRIRFCSE